MINIKNAVLNKGSFTIVELIVVVAIIGIIAGVATVSYFGVVSQANGNTISTDLAIAASKFKKYYLDHGEYPASLSASNCPLDSNSLPDNKYCLFVTTGASLIYNGGIRTFTLIETKNGTNYEITNSVPAFNFVGIPITAVAAITGTLQISQTLTAGAITPVGATVSYQWQSAAASSAVYTNISGATSNTYAVSPNVMNKNIRVVVTGTGSYGGLQTAMTNSVVANDPNWLTIGTQTWAKANLNVGTMVTGVTEQTNNSTLEKYCYSDTEAYCTTYGGLYQWNEAMQYVTTAGAQGVCPAGSHIPTDNDWKILEIQLGMTQAEADSYNFRGTDQGTQLKSGGSSGLNMPLAGNRITNGSFAGRLSFSHLWSSSEYITTAWERYITSGNVNVYRNMYVKASGLSIRCLGN